MAQFGLIGFPLKNSFSKDFFSKKFKELKLDGFEYANFELEDIGRLPQLILNHKSLTGFNVTIPHKQSVIKYLDKLDISAKEVGAVNCVKIHHIGTQGKYECTGYNTDIIGFEKSLKNFIDFGSQKPESALILGSGGAALAVAFILKKNRIAHTIVSRKPAKENNTILYQDLNEETISNNKLIVNCTPLGSMALHDKCPDIPYQFLTEKHFCYDLVYLPEKTLFLQKAELQKSRIKNGLEMLYLQAEEAWEIWNEAQVK